MSTPRTILEMRDVSRSFTQGGETIEALKKTSVTIYAGELVAVIGPSGSGKSTFLTIAGGLQSPSSGKVFINGIDITGLNNKQRSDTRFSNIGFILQASNLVPFLTIEKQLLLRDDVNGIRSNKLKSDELFNELGIERLRKKYPNELSGGERQRAAIAKVLYGEPKLILADEPTASLDSQRAFEVVELLAKETRGQERATIMVTHDERLIKFCDKVYEMHDGVLTERKKTASL
jgi:putative ABC transport system ATP-binding protein